MELFKIIGTVALDGVEQFNQDVDSASEHGSKFATALGNGLKTMASVGVAALTTTTAAVGALTKQAISNFAEYEQLIGGVETLYGATEEEIQRHIDTFGEVDYILEQLQNRGQTVLLNASEAYKTAGMSANEYMNTVNSFAASLTSSLGDYSWQAANYAHTAVTDMADNANKMGTSMESIQNAYQGFAKQNFTMLDNLKLGYGGTKEEMERLMRDAEELAGYMEGSLDMNNFSNVVDAIHIIQESMGITGTTAKEASKTISGSIASMKAAWANLLTGLADDTADMEDLVADFSESVVTAAENVVPVLLRTLPNIASSMIDLADTLMTEHVPEIVQDLISGLLSSVPQLTTTLFNLGTQILTSLIQGIEQNASALSQTAVDIAVGFVQFVLENLPTIISAGAEILVNLALGIADAIPELASTAVATITQLVDTLTDPETLEALLEAAVEIITALGIAITENLPLLVDAAIELVTKLVDFITREDNLGLLIDTAITFITTISMALMNNLPLLVDAALKIVLKLVDELTKTENLEKIIQAGVELFLAIIKKIPEIILQVGDAARQIVDKISEKLSEGISKAFGIGEEMGRALTNGFKSGLGSLLSGGAINVSGVGSSVFSAAVNQDIPKMAKGGVLGKGQLGLLEGDGAEAVVPLDQNRAWISAVAADMNAAGIGGQPSDTQALKDIFQDFLGAFPDMIEEAFSKMKFDVNNREFARLVKAVN